MQTIFREREKFPEETLSCIMFSKEVNKQPPAIPSHPKLRNACISLPRSFSMHNDLSPGQVVMDTAVALFCFVTLQRSQISPSSSQLAGRTSHSPA